MLARLVRLSILVLFLTAVAAMAQTDMYLEEGIRLFDAGDFVEAGKYFKTVAKQEPANSEAAYYLGRIAYEEGKYDDSIELFKQATELKTGVSDYHLWLAHAYVEKLQRASMIKKLGLAGNAKDNFIRAVELDPNSVEAQWAMADFYWEAPGIAGGDKEKAMEHVSRLAELDPRRAHMSRAYYYGTEEKWDLAEAELQALIDLNPENADAHFRLGRMHQDRESYDNAFDAFEKALAIDAGYMPALYQIGRSAVISASNLDRGVECLQDYLKTPPPSDSPSWASAHWRLGMLYELRGEADKARGQFESALELDPDHDEAKKALKKLK